MCCHVASHEGVIKSEVIEKVINKKLIKSESSISTSTPSQTPQSTAQRKRKKHSTRKRSTTDSGDWGKEEKDECEKGKGGRRRSKDVNIPLGMALHVNNSPDHTHKRKSLTRVYNKIIPSNSATYTQPDQTRRGEIGFIHSKNDKGLVQCEPILFKQYFY